MPSKFRPIENRYNASEWEINPNSWLWSPSTKLALLGDGYGTNQARSSGPGKVTGKLSAASMWKTGNNIARRGVSHNGIDQGVLFTPITLSSGSCTLATWIHASSGVKNDTLLVCGSGSTNVIYLYWRYNRAFGLRILIGANEYRITSSRVYAGETVHVCGVWDQSAVKLYLDGVDSLAAVEASTASGPFTVSGGYFKSTGATYNNAFTSTADDGDRYDMCLFDAVLTPPQIRQLASIRPDMGGLIRSKRRIIYPVASTPTARTTITRLSTLGLPSRRYGGFIAKEQIIPSITTKKFVPIHLWYHVI